MAAPQTQQNLDADSLDEISKLDEMIASVKLPADLAQNALQMVNRVKRVARMGSYSQEFELIQKYLEWITTLPWGKYTQDNLDLIHAKEILDKHHYGLDEIKERVLEYLAVVKLKGAGVINESNNPGTPYLPAGRSPGQKNQVPNENKAQGQTSVTLDSQMPTQNAEQTLLRQGSGGQATQDVDEMKKLQGSSAHAPILSFVGVQGIGKTSIAKSIASALGRKFVRVALGAIGNVSELRGIPKASPNGEPGQIVKALVRTGVMNPVILLDEIDKVSSQTGLRSDVMAALLEILDPEQNSAFIDHYIDYPLDLSKVIFITTANNLGGITTALLDRLEVIRFSSYSDEEKQVIARDYLLPKVREATGITEQQLSFADDVWPLIIRPLGFDAGVRQLERTLTTLSRKVAKLIIEGQTQSVKITVENFRQFIPEDIGVYS